MEVTADYSAMALFTFLVEYACPVARGALGCQSGCKIL